MKCFGLKKSYIMDILAFSGEIPTAQSIFSFQKYSNDNVDMLSNWQGILFIVG